MKVPMPPQISRPTVQCAVFVIALLLSACGEALGPGRETTQLTFVRGPSYDTLYAVDLNNGIITQRGLLPSTSFRIKVSPDGKRVALVHNQQLWVMNLDGSNAVQVATAASNVSWAPDGRRLAYFTRLPPFELHLVNADGTGDTLLPAAEPGGFQGLDWSPDGRRIAFEGMRDDGARTIFIINATGGGLIDLSAGTAESEVRPTGEPSWSPDGSQLAFSRFTVIDFRAVYKLGVRNLATGEEQMITSGMGNDFTPSWSPTGEWIAFVHEEDNQADVFVVRPNGTGLRRVTNTPDHSESSADWLVSTDP